MYGRWWRQREGLTLRNAPACRTMPSAERRAPSAERRAPSAERRAPSAERRAHNCAVANKVHRQRFGCGGVEGPPPAARRSAPQPSLPAERKRSDPYPSPGRTAPGNPEHTGDTKRRSADRKDAGAILPFAAALLLTLGTLATGADRAEAQTTIDLVSNSGQTESRGLLNVGTSDAETGWAQQFTTGPSAAGYNLDALRIGIGGKTGTQPGLGPDRLHLHCVLEPAGNAGTHADKSEYFRFSAEHVYSTVGSNPRRRDPIHGGVGRNSRQQQPYQVIPSPFGLRGHLQPAWMGDRRCDAAEREFQRVS